MTRALAGVVLALGAGSAHGQSTMYVCKGQTYTEVGVAGGTAFVYTADGSSVTIGGNTFLLSDIDSITFEKPVFPSIDDDGIVYIKYEGATATVTVPASVSGVTYETAGAHVTVTSTNTADKLTFSLSGTSPDGAFTYNGLYKCRMIFNGLDLTSLSGPAVNILCGKTIDIELAEGTENVLADAANDDHKACLYVKGHPEFSKGGSLTVSGNYAHAIKTKEYCLLKKTLGRLTVASAVKDGIHAGQYFRMNGGTVTIGGTGGDGVQAEITDDATDEWNGQLMLNGGTLAITTAADTCDAVKADSLITINGGTLAVKASGRGAKGIKAKDDLAIHGGTVDIATTGATFGSSGGNSWGGGGGRPGGGGGGRPGGGGFGPGGDTSGSDATYSKAVRAAGDITIDGGDITLSTSTDGSEGLESKSGITISGGDLYVKAYDDAINAATSITVSGGRVYAYSTGNDAVDCNGNTTGCITISGGVLVAASAKGAPEEGIDCDNAAIRVSGGYLFTIGSAQGNNAPSVPTASTATQPTALLRSVSLTGGRYLSVQSSDNATNYFTLKLPFSFSGSYSLVSCPGFARGSSYKVVTGTSAPTGCESEWNGFYVGGSCTGTTTLKTIAFSSNFVSL